jgi:gamma-glutamyltranspeptidase/glutathione hydrolase
VEETANAVHTYTPGGKAPNEYDVRRNPDLARTYRMIAEGGRDAFYDGPSPKPSTPTSSASAAGSLPEDLREHHAEWDEPLVTNYRGVDVYAMAANTQGLATLQMLNIIEQFDMREFGLPIRAIAPRADRSQAARL